MLLFSTLYFFSVLVHFPGDPIYKKLLSNISNNFSASKTLFEKLSEIVKLQPQKRARTLEMIINFSLLKNALSKIVKHDFQTGDMIQYLIIFSTGLDHPGSGFLKIRGGV